MKNMRKVAWFVCLFVSLSFSSFNLPIRAFAMEAETEAMLVEGAKKEANLMIYESWTVQGYAARMKAFQQKYPFIDVKSRRDISGPLLVRVLAEAKANRHVADIIDIRGNEIDILKKRGLLMKYRSPNFRFIAPEYIDPDGYYWVDDYTVQSLAYNTKLISPNDAPSAWEDLLNPKWKGKMSFSNMDYEWMGNMLAFMGEEKGREYMKKLGRQDIRIGSGKRLLALLLAAGETQIFLTASGHTIEELRGEGAPVKWVPINPIMIIVDSMGILAHTSHPNAAKLYTNFISSLEGQNLVAMTSGANPIRADATKYKYPQLNLNKRGYKFIRSSLTIDHYSKYGQEFRKIFMERNKK